MGNPAEKRSVTRTILTMHSFGREVKRPVRLFLQKVTIIPQAQAGLLLAIARAAALVRRLP